MIIRKGNTLLDKDTGEILSDNCSPKFYGWTYNMYKEAKECGNIRYLEAMSAYEYDSPEKLEPILKSSNSIAEQKFDGHRGLLQITQDGNRAFSKRISKKTNWFSENSDCIPHIRDAKIHFEYMGTVLDGEIVTQSDTSTSTDVQSITGSLPEKAIENQLASGFAKYIVFDIIYYKGVRIVFQSWYKRRWKLFLTLKSINNPYITMAKIYVTEEAREELERILTSYTKEHEALEEFMSEYVETVDSYDAIYENMLEEGKEGLIIKDILGIYEVGKKSKAFVKMKNKSTYDVVIMGYQDPTEDYSGKELNKLDGVWEYWKGKRAGDIRIVKQSMEMATKSGYKPITKPYAKGWIGAIEFGVWKERHLQYYMDKYGDAYKEVVKAGIEKGTIVENGKHKLELVKVGEAKGLTDRDLEYIKNHGENIIGDVIEVIAQGIINKDTGTLRHPRFKCLRPDKNSKDCTWEDHIRE